MPRKHLQILSPVIFVFLILTGFNSIHLAIADTNEIGELLEDAIDGPHRSETNRKRDIYRHPKETLLFFGLKPEMSVVEISPGNGWYSEIIAPVLKSKGHFFAAVPITTSAMPESMKRRDAAYRQMISSDSFLYGSPTLINFDSAAPEFAPNGSVDMVLTFRNVHNWEKSGHTKQMFNAFYRTLKKGGILGVVEHRANPATTIEKQIETGYMTESFVIEAAKSVGFKLIATSDINNNPLDSKNHPSGVWNLPPTLRDVNDQNKSYFLAIGESDRMTLKFIKP